MIHLFLLLLNPVQELPQKQVKLEDIGFVLNLPGDWQVKIGETEPFAAVARLPPRQALLMVSRAGINEKGAHEVGLEPYLTEMSRAFNTHEVMERKTLTLADDINGIRLAIRGTAREIDLRHLTYIFTAYEQNFTVSFATEQKLYDQLEPVFEQIMATLVLSGPPNRELTNKFLAAVKAKPVDYKLLGKLLAAGADINAVGEKRMSALMYATLKRQGPLAKWLLENGADLKDERNNYSMLRVAAPPPIRALFKQKLGEPTVTEAKKTKEGALKIHWTSTEAELFAGIWSARLAYVKEALEKGADLTALEPNYKLAALALTHKLMQEFEELGLDATGYEAIEKLLSEAQKGGVEPSP